MSDAQEKTEQQAPKVYFEIELDVTMYGQNSASKYKL